jgi:hypothetical protein
MSTTETQALSYPHQAAQPDTTNAQEMPPQTPTQSHSDSASIQIDSHTDNTNAQETSRESAPQDKVPTEAQSPRSRMQGAFDLDEVEALYPEGDHPVPVRVRPHPVHVDTDALHHERRIPVSPLASRHSPMHLPNMHALPHQEEVLGLHFGDGSPGYNDVHFTTIPEENDDSETEQ